MSRPGPLFIVFRRRTPKNRRRTPYVVQTHAQKRAPCVSYSPGHVASPQRATTRATVLATRRALRAPLRARHASSPGAATRHARHASPQRPPRVTASPLLQILPRVTASPTPQMVPRVPRTVWPLKTHAWPSARAFYPCVLSLSQNRASLRTFLLPTHALHVPCAPFHSQPCLVHVFVQFCP